VYYVAIELNRIGREFCMSSDLKLDNQVYQAIERHCTEGDRLTEAGDFELALAEYQQAWALLPDPQRAWEAATWIKIAIADACFFAERYVEAEEALSFAQTCPGGLGNPYVDLRLGQVLFEQGETEAARECLERAYQEGGEPLFEGEDDKYRVWSSRQ
jgi:tetratricopeptide (TPR) repeat protein